MQRLCELCVDEQRPITIRADLGRKGFTTSQPLFLTRSRGDLVFFTGTYDTPGVSHVGIYVGEDGDGSPVMLHCGDPIQYSKLDTSYWQSHFYAYGG